MSLGLEGGGGENEGGWGGVHVGGEWRLSPLPKVTFMFTDMSPALRGRPAHSKYLINNLCQTPRQKKAIW